MTQKIYALHQVEIWNHNWDGFLKATVLPNLNPIYILSEESGDLIGAATIHKTLNGIDALAWIKHDCPERLDIESETVEYRLIFGEGKVYFNSGEELSPYHLYSQSRDMIISLNNLFLTKRVVPNTDPVRIVSEQV